MKKLNLYITKQIIVGFLLVCCSLMSIIWLTQSLRFLEMISSEGITIGTFIKMTSLLMPRIFTILAPISLFAAILFVYNRMIADQELIVMKAVGISPFQLSKPIFFISFFLIILNVWIMNCGIPMAEKAFNNLEWKVKNNISGLMFREGEFSNIQPGLTVFITSRNDDGSVLGILINDERKPPVSSTTTAEKGAIIQTPTGPRIVLVNGSRQELNHKNNQFSSISFEKYSVDLGIKNTKARRKSSVRTQSFAELINALNNPNLSPKDKIKWFVEGNKRLTTPLLALVYSLIGCTGLLISNFNRRGQTKTVIISLTAVIFIQAIDLSAGNLASKNIFWISFLYLNIIVPILVCIILLQNPKFLSLIFKKKKEQMYA